MVFILPFPKGGSFLKLGIDMACYICSNCLMLLPRLYKRDKSAGGNLLSSFAFLQTYANLLASLKEGENGDQSTFLKIGAARKREDK